jgi:hypothetical protein
MVKEESCLVQFFVEAAKKVCRLFRYRGSNFAFAGELDKFPSEPLNDFLLHGPIPRDPSWSQFTPFE